MIEGTKGVTEGGVRGELGVTILQAALILRGSCQQGPAEVHASQAENILHSE